jgi:hypothetical protein
MDALHARLDALEHQIHTLHQQVHAVDRRLRWWRRLACGLGVLGFIGWTLQAVTAGEGKFGEGKVLSLPDRFAALERKLAPLTFNAVTNEVVITGANLRIINGLGQTDCGPQDHPMPDCPNGLGNLFVGYNEPREGGENIRNGSHNVVVGKQHQFSSVGGLVVGLQNEIRGVYTSVSGGVRNTAAGAHASISGGKDVRQEAKEGWAAGSSGAAVAGRFRSP